MPARNAGCWPVRDWRRVARPCTPRPAHARGAPRLGHRLQAWQTRRGVLGGATSSVQSLAPGHHGALQRLSDRRRGPPGERLPRACRIPRPRRRDSAATLGARRQRCWSGLLSRTPEAEPTLDAWAHARARPADMRAAARPTARVKPAHAHTRRMPRAATPCSPDDARALPAHSDTEQESAPGAQLRAAVQTPRAEPDGNEANGRRRPPQGHARAHTERRAHRAVG